MISKRLSAPALLLPASSSLTAVVLLLLVQVTCCTSTVGAAGKQVEEGVTLLDIGKHHLCADVSRWKQCAMNELYFLFHHHEYPMIMYTCATKQNPALNCNNFTQGIYSYIANSSDAGYYYSYILMYQMMNQRLQCAQERALHRPVCLRWR